MCDFLTFDTFMVCAVAAAARVKFSSFFLSEIERQGATNFQMHLIQKF